MKPTIFLFVAFSVAALASHPECPVETNVKSRAGDSQKVSFTNEFKRDVYVYWVSFVGKEVPSGIIGALETTHHDSYDGHVFRFRTGSGELVQESVVLKKDSRDRGNNNIAIKPCGKEDVEQLWDLGRDVEFKALTHHHEDPCLPHNDSQFWSCVRYLPREEVAKRNASEYGFQLGEVPDSRIGDTFDKTYTSQIPRIPRIAAGGSGYLKMTMTQGLKDAMLEWYEARKLDAMHPHGVIPGGYTNNHVVDMSKIDLDHYPEVQMKIIREMKQVLQWWTQMPLKHTSTFGVRIYHRDSMLIDHVDRMDTHLASAVLQVNQQVDVNGGWPLEVLLPDGAVGEVYLQPGEMVLYEGAWLRHGRPMRFRGDEFGNVFSHFAPLEWKGLKSDLDAQKFYGYAKGRCNTLADDIPRGRCTVPEAMKHLETELDIGSDSSEWIFARDETAREEQKDASQGEL